MEKKVNLFIFNLSSDGVSMDTIKNRFQEDSRVNFEVIRLYKDMSATIMAQRNAVLFFKVETKAEFVQSLSILKTNQELIKQGFVRPVCFLGVNSRKVERLLFKYGCVDILQININPKTLYIKAELWVKSLYNLLKDEKDFMTLGQRAQENEDHHSNKEHQFKKPAQKEKPLAEDDLLDDDFDKFLDELDEDIQTIEFKEDFEDEDLKQLMEQVDAEEIQEEFQAAALEQIEEDSNDLRIVTTEESAPELVDYIKENGEIGQLNLETGYLGLSLMSDTTGESFNCVFENFEEDHMTLEVTEDFQAKEGEKLDVSVKFVYNKCRVKIYLSGVVSDIELMADGKKQVTISFSQNESEIYDYFMSLYEKRQKSINDFMELARGY